MKGILILCGGILLAAVVGGLWYLFRPDRYGEEFTGAPLVQASMLLEKPQEYLGKSVQIEGIVKQQCASTGCYFFFPVGEKLLRVEMGEVVSHIPPRSNYHARVEGELGKYGEGYQFYGKAVQFQREKE